MRKINTNQLFSTFLEKRKEVAKQQKELSIIKVCNRLLENTELRKYKVHDVLSMENYDILKLHGMGNRTYQVLCEMLENVREREKWTLFRGYKKRILKKGSSPTITVIPVTVQTDPETIVYQINVDGNNGVWSEVANTPQEAKMFLRGMQAMNSFAGLPMLVLPEIPEKSI